MFQAREAWAETQWLTPDCIAAPVLKLSEQSEKIQYIIHVYNY